MKRISKTKCNGTLEGVILSSENGFVRVEFKRSEWRLNEADGKTSIYSKELEDKQIILKIKETGLSFMYELTFENKKEIKEEIKMKTTNIFEQEKVLVGEDFHKNNEKFIEFESENEKGFGLVKDSKVFIPCKEVNGEMECIIYDYEKLRTYELESFEEYILPEESFIYRFNKTEAINFNKKQDIELFINSSHSLCFQLDDIDYVYLKYDKLIFKHKGHVYLLEKIKTNTVDFIVSSIIEEDYYYEGYSLKYKRYISKKATKGITDLRSNPFAWLSY